MFSIGRKVIALSFVLVVGALSLSARSSAQDDAEREKYALSNLQSELTTCGAFYLAAEQCLRNTPGQQETADVYRGAANAMLQNAIAMGRSIGMTEDAIVSRFKLLSDDMMNLMQRNCSNIDSLTSRHQERCQAVYKDPQSIAAEYRAKFREGPQ
jgi:hypothetical protein